MSITIQLRKDTSTNWTSTNPTLANGEAGYETDTKLMKVGDGVTAWTSLSYFKGEAEETNPNHVLNGGFLIAQAGGSFAASTGAVLTVDRWNKESVGSTMAFAQTAFALGQTDVPGNPKYYARVTVASVAGNGNLAYFRQKIPDVTRLSGGKATISFYAKADANKNISVEVAQTFGTGGSPSASVLITPTKIALTTAWQLFTITIDVPSVSGKALGTDNNDFISIFFWLDAGSDYNARTDSLGQQSGVFDLAQVKMEQGDTRTPFEQEEYETELAQCQAFRYRITAGEAFTNVSSGYNSSTSSSWSIVHFPVTMIRVPSTFLQSGTAGDYTVVEEGASVPCTSVPTATVRNASVDRLRYDAASALTAHRPVYHSILTVDAFLEWRVGTF